jgi:uncharacterized protein YceH (UPF0502 family)
MLDRTEQRVVGVLIEKELSVPDTYPLSENALVDGCNQKSNREPVLELQPFQVAGALMALQEKGFVARLDGAGRVAKYRHRLVDRWALDHKELAVLAELLVRGPQAPGALKPRLQRMGCHDTPEAIEALLRKLASRPEPLVQQLPHAPRERDQRWRHLLGPGGDGEVVADAAARPALTPLTPRTPEPPTAATPSAGPPAAVPPVGAATLEQRVAALEQQVAALRQQLARRDG